MQQKSLLGINPAGFHKIAYTEWGDASAQSTILCLHGLTRNGRDFDYLGQNLSDKYRTICPDLPGRGSSEPFADPLFYNQAQYASDLTALIARLDVASLVWIGTSLGGLVGMYLAAQPNTPIKALILNDVGPVVSKVGLSRIGKYATKDRVFTSIDDAEQYLRRAYNTQEAVSDQQWRHMAECSVWQLPDGQFTLAYDPKAGKPLNRWWITDMKFWPWWSNIKCPVLVLRGQQSDILLPETTMQMQKKGPNTTVIEIPGCGHAPLLMTKDQIDHIRTWLAQHS